MCLYIYYFTFEATQITRVMLNNAKSVLPILSIVSVIVLTYSINSKAQSPAFVWSKGVGGTNGDYGYGIVCDGAGNVYITGNFNGTVDFDPGPGVYNLTSGGDGYILKLDSFGNFVWAKEFAGTGSSNSNAIAIDASGKIYVSGYFSGTVDFDPNAGVYNLTAAGSNFRDAFVLKIDSLGNLIWARCMGGTNDDFGFGISIDASANVYTTGTFQGISDYDPGAAVFNLISAGNTDVFVSKLDSSGNFVWAKGMGGTDNDYVGGAANDVYGNIYITGNFRGTSDYDPGSGVFNLTSAGSDDIFISKLNSSGSFMWAKRMGGNGGDVSYSIAVDAFCNAYTTGYFSDTVDFDPGTGIFNLISNGGADMYVSKIDSSGNFVWAGAPGGTGNSAAVTITVDAAGSPYTTGYFTGTVDFDPGAGVYNLSSGLAPYAVFFTKLNPSGNVVWAKSSISNATDYGKTLTFDATGNVLSTGYFGSTSVIFGNDTLVNAGPWDIFVTKIASTLQCFAPTLQANNIIFSNVTSNSMQVNWTNGNGSRRIVKMKTSNSFTTPVNGVDYIANPAYLGGEQTIYNGTGNSVTVTGLSPHTIYWFRVYEASCSASNSFYLTSTATGNPRQRITAPASPSMNPNRLEADGEEEEISSFEIYPNPTRGEFTVKGVEGNLEIYALVGEKVYALQLYGKEKTVNCKLIEGIYFVKASTEHAVEVKRLVIE
jgi:hypothetical protein